MSGPCRCVKVEEALRIRFGGAEALSMGIPSMLFSWLQFLSRLFQSGGTGIDPNIWLY